MEMCCSPVLPSGNGLEPGIPGLGVGSKQRQLRKCLCRCELNARTITYKQIYLQWLHAHKIRTQNDSLYAMIVAVNNIHIHTRLTIAGAYWAEWSAALTGGGGEEQSVYACVHVWGQRTWHVVLLDIMLHVVQN